MAAPIGCFSKRLLIPSKVLAVPMFAPGVISLAFYKRRPSRVQVILGLGRHNCAVGVTRIYLTSRSARPNRLGHTGGGRRPDPLCLDLGIPHLCVPTNAREAADANTARTIGLSRERRKNPFPRKRSEEGIQYQNRKAVHVDGKRPARGGRIVNSKMSFELKQLREAARRYALS
jgi:hypothetical protein